MGNHHGGRRRKRRKDNLRGAGADVVRFTITGYPRIVRAPFAAIAPSEAERWAGVRVGIDPGFDEGAIYFTTEPKPGGFTAALARAWLELDVAAGEALDRLAVDLYGATRREGQTDEDLRDEMRAAPVYMRQIAPSVVSVTSEALGAVPNEISIAYCATCRGIHDPGILCSDAADRRR